MADIKELCAEMISAEANQNYHKLLDAANKRKFKILRLGLFDDALKLIAEVPPKQLGNASVEKSYILYRQNKNDESLQELSRADAENPMVQELKAQLYYRQNRFQEAYDIYRSLCRNLDDDDFDDLRRANLLAVTAKLQETGINREPTTSELDTHEQLYNHACHLIAIKRYEEASKILQQAEELCVAALKADGFSEQEIDEELKPIKAQRKYLKHQASRSDPARKAERAKLKRKKKQRLPKNYDPRAEPDPERWLPKQERAAYKKKVNKKFKDRNVGRGTQGTSSVNADKIDYSNTTPKESTQSPKPTPPPLTVDGPRQQAPAQRKQQVKRKKKGGNRW